MTKTRKMLLKSVGITILFILCMVPGLVLSFNSLQEPWTAFRVARATLSLQESRLVTFVTAATGYRAEHSGNELLHAALLDATKWPAESIVLLPIGSVLLAILYYAISKTISGSTWTATGITLYASWYYPRLVSQFGTNTYAWTNVLFLTFLLLFYYWLKKRTATLSILILLVFSATFLHYHSTPIWILAALTISVAVTKLKDIYHTRQGSLSYSSALPLFCFVFYFAFDTVVYGNALVRIRTEQVNEYFFQSFVKTILAPLLQRSPTTLSPFEVAPLNPRLATWSTLCVLLLLTVPIAYWGMRNIYETLVLKKEVLNKKDDLFVFSVVFAAIAHALMYMIYGALSLRVIPLAFPFLVPIIMRQVKGGHKIEKVWVFFLALSAVVGFISFSTTLRPDMLASETGLATKLLKANSQVLADANFYGSLLLNTVEDGKVIDLVWLDSEKYFYLLDNKKIQSEEFDYFAVELSGKPTISSNWQFFEPWTEHLTTINQHTQLEKIYHSEKMMVLQPKDALLPPVQIEPDSINLIKRSFIIDLFNLLGAVSILFIIPGAVLLFMMQITSDIKISIDSWPGLVIGLSIMFATFVGYVTNFTPLGLGWLIPSLLVLPWIILALYRNRRKIDFRFQFSWLLNTAVFITVLLVWSFLSTQIAHTRTESRTEFTEFFMTQPASQPESITVNLVSRLKQPENFSFVFQLDGGQIEEVVLKAVMPNFLLMVESPLLPTSADERLLITLKRDGIPYRTLSLIGPPN